MKFASWKDHEPLAEHYKAIQAGEIYLADYDGCREFPWEYVTKCEPGGTHRIDIATSVWFRATGPSGLQYRWTFDIEERSANGSGSYQIKTAEISHIIGLLGGEAKKAFKEYLAGCAKAVQSKGDEYNEVAKIQYGTAAQLERLAT